MAAAGEGFRRTERSTESQAGRLSEGRKGISGVPAEQASNSGVNPVLEVRLCSRPTSYFFFKPGLSGRRVIVRPSSAGVAFQSLHTLIMTNNGVLNGTVTSFVVQLQGIAL